MGIHSLVTYIIKSINSLVNSINMKFIIVLFFALALAAASAQDTCQLERNVVKKLAMDISARTEVQPKGDGECSDGEGWACIGEILETVMTASLTSIPSASTIV